MSRRPHVLAVRLDSLGDVLITGPAVRALAAGAERLTMLASPRGAAAAQLLPGVDEVIITAAPWIDPDPDPVDPAGIAGLVSTLKEQQLDEAVIFTSFHQSALPTALVLRLAGVRFVAAISDDYPGALLDVRHRVGDDLHEVERALSLAEAAGHRLPGGDDGSLAVRDLPEPAGHSESPYVVVHPGASVPARTLSPERWAGLAAALAADFPVLVTGSSSERSLTAFVAEGGGAGVSDRGGAHDLGGLAGVLAGAAAVVVGNTGPAHLAAAVGTPVVSIFAPTVPAARWRPWNVPQVLLGNQEIGCAGCRARTCPVPGHPCLDAIGPAGVASAVRWLVDHHAATPVPGPAGPQQAHNPEVVL